MKMLWSPPIKRAAFDISILLLVLLLLSTGQADLMNSSNHFRTSSKNILFSSTFGGSSHNNWVLRILDELHERGHNVVHATTDDNLRFSAQRSHVKQFSIGPSHTTDRRRGGNKLTVPMSFDMVKYYQANTIKHYEQNYRILRTIIEAESIDLVICDHNAYACHDVVRDIKIPYIVTMINNDAPDAAAPYVSKKFFSMKESTTETLPYTRRFYEAFVWPVEAIWHLGPGAWKSGLSLQPFGISFYHQEQQWDGALKLVNNLFGIDDARPRGPLVEHVGPIYGDHALSETLDPAMAQFLDTRKKVVYMAFGQHAQSSSLEDSTRLLRMLFDNYEDNVLDGFIWSATRGTPLPEKIVSKSGTTYAINDTQRQVGWITSWAPQTAILRHPSVITFVSHGGAMSVFEAAYHGKRMLFCPFVVDQFANAKHFEHAIGAGRLWFSLEQSTVDEMARALRRVVEDHDGMIQKSMQRYQALVQIHGQHALTRAADLCEEALFTSNSDGKLPHRIDVAHRLSFLKRHNYDLYLGLFTLVVGIAALLYRITLSLKESMRVKTKVQ